MKEIELTPKAEEDLEAIWDYSFREFGVVQADAYIGRIAAVFDVLAMHDIGTHRAELGRRYLHTAGGTAHDLFCIITFYGYGHSYSQPVSGYGAA
ncbi:Plasmid stabilisation system protein [Klebsiella michiganensis]|nr:Plasmid stabilisation system protein [Klebsiella michiganensis]